MKNYELYIDKKLIELDDKFNFALIFNSSVFQDISKVKSNRTSTIKIPKTANNLAAIDFSNMPENITEFPYRTKDVKLFKNGLPIIDDGKGYVLAISDSIEFAITWGVDVDIKSLQELKLRELPDDDPPYYVRTLSDVMDSIDPGDEINESNGYGFAAGRFVLSNDILQSIAPYHVHPFVRLQWIMERVIECAGIPIDFPNKINNLYKTLITPLVEKNPFSSAIVEFNFTGNFDIFVINDDLGYISGNEIIINEECEIHFEGDIKYFTNLYFVFGFAYLHIFKNDVLCYKKTGKYSPNLVEIMLTEESSIKCNAGDRITFMLEIYIPFEAATWNPVGTTDGSFKIYFQKEKEVQPGENYPIIPNLPDITGFDMLNTIMAMFGLFGNYTKDGIKLYSIDEFYDKKPQAKDWTDKVITGSNINSISFSFADFAQKNYLHYLKDETVITDADWYLEVDNDTLDEEKTLYQMKFAASDNSVYEYMFAFFTYPVAIPFYKENKDSEGLTTIEFNKTTNRLAVLSTSSIPIMATFPSELSFNNLINTYYSDYQKIILRPKMIEVSLLLSDLDIYTLDMMTPVYIEQTGNYYIIYELQIDGNNVAKAKLLQM